MSEHILTINSINQLCEILGYDKPKHPLIAVLDASKLVITKEMVESAFLQIHNNSITY